MNGKLLITKYNEQLLAALISKNRLLAANFFDLEKPTRIGEIYIGKIKNIMSNMKAYFVEIQNGEICFLPFSEAKEPVLLNRIYDGRLIQEDEIIVQIVKSPIKSKQATITTKITLAGEYFIFSLGRTRLGLSNKLTEEKRKAIKDFMLEEKIIEKKEDIVQHENIPPFGIIVRTSAGGVLDNNILRKEYYYLKEEFFSIFLQGKHRTCFSLIREIKTPILSFLSFSRSYEYDEIVTDISTIKDSILHENPNIIVRLYNDPNISLLKLYTLDSKIKEATQKNVWLKSGGYIVIEQTESLTAIDVNSGKFILKKEAEESALMINKEAAFEVAIQLRLRNISGIIIVDFINMKNPNYRKELLTYLKQVVSTDHTLTKVLDYTALGLVEMTRKKIQKSLKEQL